MIVIRMANSSLCVVSNVRGYHIYKDDWNPDIGNLFDVEVEETNIHDRFVCADLHVQVVAITAACFLGQPTGHLACSREIG